VGKPSSSTFFPPALDFHFSPYVPHPILPFPSPLHDESRWWMFLQPFLPLFHFQEIMASGELSFLPFFIFPSSPLLSLIRRDEPRDKGPYLRLLSSPFLVRWMISLKKKKHIRLSFCDELKGPSGSNNRAEEMRLASLLFSSPPGGAEDSLESILPLTEKLIHYP